MIPVEYRDKVYISSYNESCTFIDIPYLMGILIVRRDIKNSINVEPNKHDAFSTHRISRDQNKNS